MLKKIITGIKSLVTTKSKFELYYPSAIINFNKIQLPTRGEYKTGYPIGAVVHYTAGRTSLDGRDALTTLTGMVNNEYCTFVISANGSVYQNFPINRWGNHAGSSKYPGVGEWVSSKLVGIELCCAGKLTQVQDRFVSWFGEEYERSQVNAVVTPRDNWKVGFYHKYTPEQEKSLISLLLWLKKNNPAIFKLDYVLGHDEVAPNRKTDPGGSLSMTMPELRDYLRGQA